MFLDSSLTDGRGGRYSFFTADPFLTVRSWGNRVELTGPAGRVVTEEDPWDLLQRLLRRYSVNQVEGLPPFVGGAVGYFGYDLGRTLERLPATATDEGLPELDIGFYDWALVADRLSGVSRIVATGLPTGEKAAAHARVAEIQERLHAAPSPSNNLASLEASRLRSNFRRADYLRAVERAREYIAAGDIFQVNLSHRIEGGWVGTAWPLYERLRAASPVSYGAYLDLGEAKVLSASPERFLKQDGRWIETRPIKGTRPRGSAPDEDRALGAQLLASEKDRAENLMIVDLLRNDIGKVSRLSTVQ
ncbi:MAG: anthranilate synthase component I family protein, partial [Actinomycetota bacterium]|nr:anthranilate synthase component I family protein [Actinomycetota bacterium]